MIGTVAEAQTIFKAAANFNREVEIPQGWEYIGGGGTRRCYRSPTGTVYKVCRENEDDEPTHNDKEFINLQKIEKCGKLRPKWRVPKNYLHVFQATYTRWEPNVKEPVTRPGRAAVLAMEYVEGELLHENLDDRRAAEEMMDGFSAVGLYDTAGDNAVKARDGNYYIIDAGEDAPLIGV